MASANLNEAADIFPGGGSAGALLRATDWSATRLGHVGAWPLALRTLVRTMLATRQATCLFWGADLVNLYNDGFIPILGEKHPRAMGQRAEECWSDAWPVVGGLLADVVSEGRAVLFEEMRVPILRAGKLEDAWWNYSYSPAFDDHGGIAGVLVVATETTGEIIARAQLEKARSDAELARHELHSIFMQAPLPMALLRGAEHRFTLVNEPYRDLVARDVLGKSLSEVFRDEEVSHFRPFLDSVYRTGEPVRVHEAPLRLVDGTSVPQDQFLDVNYQPYRDTDGSVSGVLAIMHDVTASVVARRHEASLREAAESASRSKDEFLAMVSHELRNPLNSILGWARVLAEGRDSRHIEKGLGVILRNAVAQAKLIDDILDVSRIIAGKAVIVMRRVRLADVIGNAVESALPAARAKGIRLEMVLDESATDLIADEDRLQQVIWNLLSNAVKFTEPGGRVRVTTAQEASRVMVRVEDTGKGIAAELLPAVFERFKQGDATTTKRHGGLGLGLAIVRHLVELHGGTVSAHSEGEGRGACFEVVLPIRAVEMREDVSAPPPSLASDERLEHPAPGSLAELDILVVDDEADARELLMIVLAKEGARVTAVSTVRDAFEALSSASFAVIVSDVGMPDEDGYAFAARVRAGGPAICRIPMLALTAYARAEDRMRARRAGFQEHVAKPVDAQALVRAIAALAQRTSRPPDT